MVVDGIDSCGRDRDGRLRSLYRVETEPKGLVYHLLADSFSQAEEMVLGRYGVEWVRCIVFLDQAAGVLEVKSDGE